VGDMTEGGLTDDDYHSKSMGIVMKRRDNAPIVKYVYGGVISLIQQRNTGGGGGGDGGGGIQEAFHFARSAVKDLLAGKVPLRRLTITKSLKAEYKQVPAHKVLADRIGTRDPGNKPASNDRIPFAYVMKPNGKPWPPKTSQGDRIETPAYILEKGLKPDYVFYVTNQIATPVSQVFGIVVDKLPGVKRHQLTAAKTVKDKEELAAELLFGDLIRDANRESNGQKDLRSFFGPTKTKSTLE